MDDVFVYSENILAGDGMTRVSGCVKLDRDMRRDRRVLDPHGDLEARQAAKRREIGLIPLDEQARALCWCGECLMWQRREAFGRDVLRGGKPRRVCKTCEAAIARQKYAEEAAAQGRSVRGYQRQLIAMQDGG